MHAVERITEGKTPTVIYAQNIKLPATAFIDKDHQFPNYFFLHF
jgi:hypothetical protein